MLVFKYIPNIMKDEGRITKELPFVANKHLQEYLTEAGFELSETRIIVTGAVVKDLNTTLKEGDEVIIVHEIKWAAIGAVLYAVFWTYLPVTLAVLSIAYSIYSLCTQPRAPTFGTSGDGLDEGSPTYGWDGITNTQDVGIPIPIVYGNHGIAGNKIIKL